MLVTTTYFVHRYADDELLTTLELSGAEFARLIEKAQPEGILFWGDITALVDVRYERYIPKGETVYLE